VWLVWIKSPSAELWARREAPNEIWATPWAGDGWGQPEQVTNTLVGGLSVDAAAGEGQTLLIAADADLDGDPSTVADREVFAFQRRAGGWSEPLRLTNNALLDGSPLAAYEADGSPVVAWLQDGALVALDGDLQAEPHSWDLAPPSGPVNLASGQLLAAVDGGLDLIWPGFTPDGLGIWRAHRASRNQPWQSAQAVVDGTAGVGVLAAGQASGGDLWLGYSRLAYGPEAPSDAAPARLPVGADLVVTRAGVLPSPSEVPTGAAPGRPSPLNCLGLGAALPMMVLLARHRKARAGGQADRESR
jgi:hypothetical protein